MFAAPQYAITIGVFPARKSGPSASIASLTIAFSLSIYVPALSPLNNRIEEGVYVLGSNAGMKVEQWGNTCQIVRKLVSLLKPCKILLLRQPQQIF